MSTNSNKKASGRRRSGSERSGSVPGRRRILAWLLSSPYPLWLLLVLPGVVLVFRYNTGAAFYGQVIHDSGDWSAWLLLLTLAITPLRLTFPGRRWIGWLMRRRRYFGLAVFGYAALHTAVYLLRKKDPAAIWADGIEPELLTGWIALFIFIPLAVTSNDWSMRALRRGWKLLHRWVHLAAVLVFVHWALSAFNPTNAYIHLSILGLIEAGTSIAGGEGGRSRPNRTSADSWICNKYKTRIST